MSLSHQDIQGVPIGDVVASKMRPARAAMIVACVFRRRRPSVGSSLEAGLRVMAADQFHQMLDYNEGTANFAFVEPEREYGPAPFGRHSACTIC